MPRLASKRQKRVGFDELPHGLGSAQPATQAAPQPPVIQTTTTGHSEIGHSTPPPSPSAVTVVVAPPIFTGRRLRSHTRKDQADAFQAAGAPEADRDHAGSTASHKADSGTPAKVTTAEAAAETSDKTTRQAGGRPATTAKSTPEGRAVKRLIWKVTKLRQPDNLPSDATKPPLDPGGGSDSTVAQDVIAVEEPVGPEELVKPEEPVKSEDGEPPPKRRRTARRSAVTKKEDDDDEYVNRGGKNTGGRKKASAAAPKSRMALYGITWGQSPWPDLARPTADECEEVYAILTKEHGEATQPEVLPPPSIEVAGCGDVNHILEALVRTHLSASTTMDNANRAIKGLTSQFRQIKRVITDDNAGTERVLYEGTDWNEVRTRPIEDLEAAIRSGGLSPTKSKNIKKMLDQVYEENRGRHDAFVKELAGQETEFPGPKGMMPEQKKKEIWLHENGVLSLDHYHGISVEEAINEFIRFPGIGVKTAACVALFCMRLPCFAVDTHIFRMCKWLGWTPQKATRDTAFVHLDLHIPDHLKYGLHQLFIRHGQDCIRCQDQSTRLSDGWDEEVCPLEHLLDRFDKPMKEKKREEKRSSVVKAAKAEEEPMAEEPEVEAEEAIINPEYEGGMSLEEIAEQA